MNSILKPGPCTYVEPSIIEHNNILKVVINWLLNHFSCCHWFTLMLRTKSQITKNHVRISFARAPVRLLFLSLY